MLNNSNWAVKLNQVSTPKMNKTGFDTQVLQNHQKNGGYISKMIQGMDWNEGIGDVNGRLDGITGDSSVPEFGSDNASQGAASEMVGDIAQAEQPQDNLMEVAQAEPDKDALDQETKTDFTVALSNVDKPVAQKVDFDQNALENHRQNGIKGTIKNMLPSIIGMIGAA